MPDERPSNIEAVGGAASTETMPANNCELSPPPNVDGAERPANIEDGSGAAEVRKLNPDDAGLGAAWDDDANQSAAGCVGAGADASMSPSPPSAACQPDISKIIF